MFIGINYPFLVYIAAEILCIATQYQGGQKTCDYGKKKYYS